MSPCVGWSRIRCSIAYSTKAINAIIPSVVMIRLFPLMAWIVTVYFGIQATATLLRGCLLKKFGYRIAS